jgi:hypothetical protein
MRTAAVLAVCGAVGLSAGAFGQTPPPRPAAPAASGHYVAIGCMARVMGTSGPTSRFQISDTRGDHPTVYRIDGDRTLLEPHVGHTVEVAGPVAVAPGTTRLTLKATSLVYIAASCKR